MADPTSGREAESAIGRLPEEPLLNQPAQDTAAIVGIELKQPRGLLNGRRESTHLDELAAHARLDITEH